ncbi:MAG: bifunctional aspartate kinase/homoserine dehydrogenase I [Bacteroidales bacterium]|nr:bifunctional aspartate kinase/homoserine dehydrogenase I [Bacteroidales bacterium]
MKVLKFGGTSMGSAKSINEVRKIILAHDKPVCAVVSAVSGVTDMLLSAASLACKGDDYESAYNAIIKKHDDIVAELFGDKKSAVMSKLEPLFADLASLLKGVNLLRELSSRSLDTISGFGERISSLILSQLMPEAKWFNSQQLIKTQRIGQRNQVIEQLTADNIAAIRPQLAEVNIFPGFISSNEQDEPTTLGRGGSDYTAAIIAAALDAEVLEIWTDVDGFMSADPRIISRAYTLDHLTYAEAMELSHFGAKVIYPPTILPVLRKDIPIYIKNTFNPTFEGTRIDGDETREPDSKIKGISSIRNVSLLTLHCVGMVGVSGLSMRLFRALASSFINVILISQASSENSISIVVEAKDAERAAEAINEEFAREISAEHVGDVRIEAGMAVVAIVGNRMKHSSGVSGMLFNALGVNGINVYAIAQGASEVNISFVIKDEDLKKSLNVIHDAFFLSHYQVLHIFLAGIGTVGGKLLEKLQAQAEKLKNSDRLVIRIAGVANSKRMILNPQGIDPSQVRDLLANGQQSSPQTFADAIKELNLANSVFVDCTASSDVAAVYDTMLENNINVVTANKIASSSAYEHYIKLKRTAKDKGVKFHYETNVGAALPIISPINDLIKSGDRILKLEAVLSGTLNFICNELSADKPLSKIIAEAKEKGYSEPDPRIDLSGTDVARKILILAREAGYKLDIEDIDKTPFVPQKYLDTNSVEEFMTKVAELDGEFERRRQELENKHLVLRYVATFENGKARIGFKEVDEHDPLYFLEGSNNIVLINSDNYKAHPMLIKGYGAGADVTASGVFADIIKVANL